MTLTKEERNELVEIYKKYILTLKEEQRLILFTFLLLELQLKPFLEMIKQ